MSYVYVHGWGIMTDSWASLDHWGAQCLEWVGKSHEPTTCIVGGEVESLRTKKRKRLTMYCWSWGRRLDHWGVQCLEWVGKPIYLDHVLLELKKRERK